MICKDWFGASRIRAIIAYPKFRVIPPRQEPMGFSRRFAAHKPLRVLTRLRECLRCANISIVQYGTNDCRTVFLLCVLSNFYLPCKWSSDHVGTICSDWSLCVRCYHISDPAAGSRVPVSPQKADSVKAIHVRVRYRNSKRSARSPSDLGAVPRAVLHLRD